MLRKIKLALILTLDSTSFVYAKLDINLNCALIALARQLYSTINKLTYKLCKLLTRFANCVLIEGYAGNTCFKCIRIGYLR